MVVNITPIIGCLIGVNYLDWGQEFYEEFGYRHEVQVGLFLFVVTLRWL